MFAIAAALLGLIALLATLQYRWLGQISGAERERMTASLNQRATGFAQDVDREVTRAYLLFQLDPMSPEQGPAAGLLARYDRWLATARFPRMLKDVYLVSPETPDHPPQLQRLDVATRFLEPAEWPGPLAAIRNVLSRETTPPRGGGPSAGATFLFRTAVPMVWPSVPAIVIPSPMWMVTHTEGRADGRTPSTTMASQPRTTIVVFDETYIDGDMLPALAQQHFQGTGDGFDYQVAVVQPGREGAAVSLGRGVRARSRHAGRREGRSLPGADQGLRARWWPKSRRFTTFTALAGPGAGGRQSQTIVRELTTAPHGTVTINGAPLSFVLQSNGGNTPAAVQQRVDKMIAGGRDHRPGHASPCRQPQPRVAAAREASVGIARAAP